MAAPGENIRRIALRWRTETLGLPVDELVPAETVLAACRRVTGIDRVTLPEGDNLLAGAYAVLDREAGMIWQSAARSEAARAFDAAHEFGHWVLHDVTDRCSSATELDDGFDPDEGIDTSVLSRIEGYSPEQRREAEANLFAGELLAPTQALKALFGSGEWDGAAQSVRLGVTPRFLRGQVQHAVLNLRSVATGDADREGGPVAHTISPDLSELDDSQREAAVLDKGPYLLGAGPGTGKTRTLVARCVHLVRDRGVAPETILALTFSNKAAQEMRERIISAGIGTDRAGPWIGTFHAFGLDLLRRYGDCIGLQPEWKLLDPVGAYLLLERNLSRLTLIELSQLANPSVYIPEILSAISRAKDELCSPEEYAALARRMLESAGDEVKAYRAAARAVELAGAYAEYEQLLVEQNCVDFGDLVAKAVRILRENRSVRRDIESQFTHVLADEYQDVNRACALLLKLTAGRNRAGLWVVGDNRQSIYRFRGASPANIDAFREDFEGARRGELAVNYRSRSEIVRLFEISAQQMNVGGHADDRPQSAWRSHRGKQARSSVPPIICAVADDEGAQADGIAATIGRLHGNEGYGYSDQAILCRSHKQAGKLARQLAERGIPVSYAGKLLERDEVRDLLAVLAAASGMRGPASIALVRVAALPEYGLSRNEAARLARSVASSELQLAEAISAFARDEALPDDIDGLTRLASTIAALETTTNPTECLELYLFEQSRYLRTSLNFNIADADFAAIVALSSIRQLLGLARSFAGSDRSGPAEAMKRAFLEHIRRLLRIGDDPPVDLDDATAARDAVRMITAHAAKGLEFPVVFLPNLSSGKFPTPDRAAFIPEPPGLVETVGTQDAPNGDRAGSRTVRDEEHCLFFVALSRAREHIVLTRAKQYGTSGRESPPSPLLGLIEDALEELAIGETVWESPSARESVQPDPATDAKPAPASAKRPTYAVHELEQYQKCPRQYYYSRVLHLGRGDVEASSSIYTAIGETMRWLRTQWAADREPDADQTTLQFDEEWKKLSGRELPVFTRSRALEMIETGRLAWRNEQIQLSPAGARLFADLDHARVTVSPDLMGHDRDGNLVVARNRYSEPKDDDHTDKRLALYRRGAKDSAPDEPAVVELRYLTHGTKRIVGPSDRWEPGRVAKYDQAAAGIAAGEFPAAPTEDDLCAGCPYYFCCPA